MKNKGTYVDKVLGDMCLKKLHLNGDVQNETWSVSPAWWGHCSCEGSETGKSLGRLETMAKVYWDIDRVAEAEAT